MKYIILFIILLCCCCNKKNKNILFEKEYATKKTFKNITLIFDNVPNKQFVPISENKIIGGRLFFENIGSYIDSIGMVQFINPKRKPNTDTLQLSINRPTIEIHFEQFGLEGFSYLFFAGDKIHIKYIKGKPKINILNRESKSFDYNYENYVNSNYSDTILSPYEKVFKYLALPKSTNANINYQKHWKIELEKNAQLLIDEIIYQKKILDSLHLIGKISENNYKYYSKKLEYINWSVLAKTKNLQLEKLNKNMSESINNKNLKPFKKLDISNKNIQTIENIIKSGDSLIIFKFYQDFLNYSFLPNYFENRVSKTTFKFNNFGGNFYNWNEVFDKINQSDLFTNKIKEYLLFKYMNNIARDLKPEITEEYYKKFLKIVKKTSYIDLLNKNFKNDSVFSKELVLLDKYENKHTLENILRQNRGKIIYIDFWASWCEPCLNVINDKRKLIEDFENENIIFISISIDKNSKEWKNNLIYKKISHLKHNYIIVNPLLSEFIKNNHILFIPRYLLIDKSGKIFLNDAPNPASKEIRTIFFDLLINNSFE